MAFERRHYTTRPHGFLFSSKSVFKVGEMFLNFYGFFNQLALGISNLASCVGEFTLKHGGLVGRLVDRRPIALFEDLCLRLLPDPVVSARKS
jgi:hypothetical protein